jgi:hypothetical protein
MKKVKRSLLPKAFIAEGFYRRRLLLLPAFVAALMLLATSCGQDTSKQQAEEPVDPFLMVAGERAGRFFLNKEYQPIEKLYEGYGFSQKTGDWLDINILRDAEIVMTFPPMMEEGEDTGIANTVGESITVFSSDFHTAENTGVGSSLEDLLSVYWKYKIKINYIPEEDYAPIKFIEFEEIELMLEYLEQNGFDNIDPYGISLTCLNSDEEETGIRFFFEMGETVDLENIKTELKVIQVAIMIPGYVPDTSWM